MKAKEECLHKQWSGLLYDGWTDDIDICFMVHKQLGWEVVLIIQSLENTVQIKFHGSRAPGTKQQTHTHTYFVKPFLEKANNSFHALI